MTVSDAERDALASSHDIIALGSAADEVRRRLHGTRTTFVRVANVGAARGAEIQVPAGAGEVRIIGTPADRAAAIARVLEVAAQGTDIPLSGFSLADLEEIALREKAPLRGILEDLQAAGLELIADAPFDRLRDPRRSVEEVNIAGLALARLTIHQLPSSDMAALYERIAALQYDVAVVRVFAPLPRVVNPAVPTTGYEDVRRVALARLFLPEIPTIQVDWSLYGAKLSQVALTIGADDLDGVPPADDLTEGRRRATREEVRRNIAAAGLVPVERNGRFDPIA